MKHKNAGLVILVLFCAVLIGLTVYTVAGKNTDRQETENAETAEESREDAGTSGTITYDGKQYKLDTSVRTVLFMGIDQQAKADLSGTPGENGQSDSLNLLVMNTGTRKAQVLQISRDSMVDIDIYSVGGEKLRTEEGQIALQYAYGDGAERSCQLTSDKVSDLLYGVRIDNYLSLTLEGMVVATDAVGGITLTVPEDYTAIDPAFQQGATVTLNGELAEKYVRTRDIEVLDSNNQRMDRQSQFMSALIEKLQGIDSTARYASLYTELEPYMVTSMTADELKDISEYSVSEEMLRVPGEIIEKDGHAQYLVNNEELQKIILELFYNEV